MISGKLVQAADRSNNSIRTFQFFLIKRPILESDLFMNKLSGKLFSRDHADMPSRNRSKPLTFFCKISSTIRASPILKHVKILTALHFILVLDYRVSRL